MCLTTSLDPRMRVLQNRICSWYLLLKGTGECLLLKRKALTDTSFFLIGITPVSPTSGLEALPLGLDVRTTQEFQVQGQTWMRSQSCLLVISRRREWLSSSLDFCRSFCILRM